MFCGTQQVIQSAARGARGVSPRPVGEGLGGAGPFQENVKLVGRLGALVPWWLTLEPALHIIIPTVLVVDSAQPHQYTQL